MLANHKSTKSIVMITTIAMLAISLAGTAGSVALAQSGSTPRSVHQRSEPRYQAPIGARQPRPQDLPTGVLRDEGHATASQRNFDKKIEICRDCGLDL